jgi:DNA polymerase I-like protein with 3'-5' exonuclease and polymerase domains
MTSLVFDSETDGLLEQLTKLHCLAFADVDTDELHSFADQPGYRPIEEGLDILAKADTIIGHNVIKFDVPAIQKVYPRWKPRGTVRDSMLTASLVYPKNPTLFDIDRKLIEADKLPKHLMGRHSLEAWGHRLGDYKGDYKGGWEKWSEEMQVYMDQDVRVTTKLWRKLLKELAAWEASAGKRNAIFECVELEHEVAWIIARQERYGVRLDVEHTGRLLGQITDQHDMLMREMANLFPPKVVRTPFIPKVNSSKFGYQKGVLTYKEKTIPFNPGSRDHVADRLIGLGWKPVERTKDGKWKVDDDILQDLPWPEAQKLARMFKLQKQIGTLSTGRGAFLKKVTKHGTIHHRCDSNGAVTGRATHSDPNMNVSKEGEFRSLFGPVNGGIQVGTDADSLEARVEAGFTVKYDGGAYREMILSGDKSQGTDVHTRNMNAIKPIVSIITRDTAKNTKYAWTYGAADWKLGFTAGAKGTREAVASAGGKIRRRMLAASPGLAKLVETIDGILSGYKVVNGKKIKRAKRDYLWGLDGRKLIVRAKHAALNTLFQSAGSVIFKKAMVLREVKLTGHLPSVIGTQGVGVIEGGFLVPGKDYEQMLWVHDETQCEARNHEVGERVGKAMEDAIREAGEHFKFDCPMAGNSDYGKNWGECH